jgi:amidase
MQPCTALALPSPPPSHLPPSLPSSLPATSQVWLATGTDLGGSLRNPASYCGVVGMRNTVGLVPEARFNAQQLLDRALPYWRLQSVSGMLARSAADLALGLDAVVGQHPGDPV